MTIKQITDLLTLTSKVEEKRAKCDEIDSQLEEIIVENNPDLWLSTYDQYKKAKRNLNKAYADFRKVFTESEIGYLANKYKYLTDNSDKNFYYYARYDILKETQHVKFQEIKH